MINNHLETNKVTVVGKVGSELEYSHELYGEGFYILYLEVPRLSEHTDVLPVTISERLLLGTDLKIGDDIMIEGQLRSYNRYNNGNNKLILTIFARDLYIPNEDEIADLYKRPNEIFLDGYICKEPSYRTTPFGREITDLLVAVNRAYNKSDYIPCIAWGRNARFCEKLRVGDHIRVWGRVQSREYQKRISEDEVVKKVAYEVSLSKLEYVKEDNNKNIHKDEILCDKTS